MITFELINTIGAIASIIVAFGIIYIAEQED